MEKEKVRVETRTIEELLLELRKEKDWTYIHIVEELYKLGITIEEKTVKKWELGLEYPNLEMIYKLSELYNIPSEKFIAAKTNSYEEGMSKVHMVFIKWFCYITGISLKIGYIGLYVVMGIALIWSLYFFLDKVDTFMEVRARMNS